MLVPETFTEIFRFFTRRTIEGRIKMVGRYFRDIAKAMRYPYLGIYRLTLCYNRVRDEQAPPQIGVSGAPEQAERYYALSEVYGAKIPKYLRIRWPTISWLGWDASLDDQPLAENAFQLLDELKYAWMADADVVKTHFTLSSDSSYVLRRAMSEFAYAPDIRIEIWGVQETFNVFGFVEVLKRCSNLRIDVELRDGLVQIEDTDIVSWLNSSSSHQLAPPPSQRTLTIFSRTRVFSNPLHRALIESFRRSTRPAPYRLVLSTDDSDPTAMRKRRLNHTTGERLSQFGAEPALYYILIREPLSDKDIS